MITITHTSFGNITVSLFIRRSSYTTSIWFWTSESSFVLIRRVWSIHIHELLQLIFLRISTQTAALLKMIPSTLAFLEKWRTFYIPFVYNTVFNLFLDNHLEMNLIRLDTEMTLSEKSSDRHVTIRKVQIQSFSDALFNQPSDDAEEPCWKV